MATPDSSPAAPSPYILRFLLPASVDKRDTLARVEVVWGQGMGAWYGTKLTGIMVKNGAKNPFAAPEPYVYFPSRHNQAGRGRAYIEAEDTEFGFSTQRLKDTILATFQAWYEEKRAEAARASS